MLIGNYQVKINEKKRTAIPSKFREELGEKLIIAQWYEKCLVIVSQNQWQNLLYEMKNKPFFTAPTRQTDRFLLGNAFEIEIDNQGRFVVPAGLADFAGLINEVIFVGLNNRVEIWNQTAWSDYQNYLSTNAEEIAEKLNQIKTDEH